MESTQNKLVLQVRNDTEVERSSKSHKVDNIRGPSCEEGEVGRISDLAATESLYRKGRGNKYIEDRQNGVRLQRPCRPG